MLALFALFALRAAAVAAIATLVGFNIAAWRSRRPHAPESPPLWRPRATILAADGTPLEVLSWAPGEGVDLADIGVVLAAYRRRGYHPRVVVEAREGVATILTRRERRIVEAMIRHQKRAC